MKDSSENNDFNIEAKLKDGKSITAVIKEIKAYCLNSRPRAEEVTDQLRKIIREFHPKETTYDGEKDQILKKEDWAKLVCLCADIYLDTGESNKAISLLWSNIKDAGPLDDDIVAHLTLVNVRLKNNQSDNRSREIALAVKQMEEVEMRFSHTFDDLTSGFFHLLRAKCIVEEHADKDEGAQEAATYLRPLVADKDSLLWFMCNPIL